MYELEFGRFELASPVSREMAAKLAVDPELKYIQTRNWVPDPTTLITLNQEVFAKRKNVAFRLYGEDSLWNAPDFFGSLDELGELQWESKSILSLEPLSELKSLRALVLGEGQLKPKISLKPLASIAPLLHTLTISGDFKDSETLLEFSKLKSLTLMSAKISFLGELSKLPLEVFGNYGSRIESLDEVGNFSGLKRLWIKNHRTVEDLGFIARLANIERLELEYLSSWKRFPACPKLAKLKSVLILTCNQLEDIDELKKRSDVRVKAWGSKLPEGRYEQ